jgi:hypothetical protein
MGCHGEIYRIISHLLRSLFDEFHSSVEFAKLMMAATRVREYLYTIQAHKNMRAAKISTWELANI